ncbi:MAG TPA: hypothetical protein VMT15_10635 [Bryobacteraceae bacterium]|nr:hypothetical protein [Bryobacteraceae bacterium]
MLSKNLLAALSLAGLFGQKIDFQGDAPAVREMAASSAREVEAFFGAPFPDPIHFKIAASRAEFDAAAAKFGLSPTQCWMVGMGTGDLMVLLSPSVWTKQACEHDPADSEATRQLITHELVHVYHGQFNSSRDFSGIDDLDWFVEGVAVFASGQLTENRLKQMQRDKLPDSLQKIWTGPSRYANAGTLVRYVDRKWGRDTTVRLLKAHSTAQALATLGTDEKSLLAGWRGSLVAR